LRDFHKICRVRTPFQDALAVKISLHLLKGLRTYGGFKLTGQVIPIFSVPPSGETMRQIPKVLEVQEGAGGPLSPCQVWWGSDFTSPPRWPKTWSFFTGSIARSTRRRYLINSEADFGFSPEGPHLAPMGVKFGVPSSMPNFIAIDATVRVYDPKTEIFTQI